MPPDQSLPEGVETFPVRICECGAIHDRPEAGCPGCGSVIARAAGEAIYVSDLPAITIIEQARQEERERILAAVTNELANDEMRVKLANPDNPGGISGFAMGLALEHLADLIRASLNSDAPEGGSEGEDMSLPAGCLPTCDWRGGPIHALGCPNAEGSDG